MITLVGYWNGRDSRYRLECTGEIRANAAKTVEAINRLLAMAEKDGISRDKVSSGWRPGSVNDATCNAAKLSNHLMALAGDIEDLDRAFAQWCLNNQDKLDKCGLYMEDPRWTPTWVHLQRVPPKSGKRVYIPSSKPPLAAALNGQKVIPVTVKT